MPQAMRFTTTGEPATMAEVTKLAWHTFYGMQKACEDFENLRFEVWTIAISLDSLHSFGTTSLLIDRQPDKARWALTFSKILTSLGAALRPLHNLVRQYLGSSSKDRASIKNWLLHSDVTIEGVTIQDFRRKLSMLVESLNVFLSCLTHAELARARETSESEEFRVLSEVSKHVLHKWDSDLPTGLRRPADRSAQQMEFNGAVNEEVKVSSSPLLQNASSGLGLQLPNTPASPVRPRHNQENPSRKTPPGVMNLEDIETGFRNHMHAMRRIREQLRHQQIDSDHPVGHPSPHFLGVSDSSKGQGWGAHPPLTPTTPTLHHNLTDSSSSSELSGEYIETSSSGSSSSDGSHHSNSGSLQSSGASSINSHHLLNIVEEETKPIQVPHQQPSYGHLRKRKRRPEYRFKTGLEAENSHSSDGDGSDEALDGGHRHPKTALERMLTVAIFFDQ
ncbi:uncharacterized protein A1O9_04159 [Exophiala aquamarina CBS 119918]|uniref:Fungal N-terminal domain-containing protein n=1 Tax=Exophiala aquamarina CBS 119918 TaxID=1182545 RepID=A0A072PUX3_9EURO|nr:uncharacterized protein A1O9_04159 [Exophiala aquamarina CBS 119918]KEF59315.1 hypothetical protein A1O9_04159 [Exophiala aquamarina CBS 119918]